MMTSNWSSVPYTRQLARPIVTAHGVYRERSGFLLAACDPEGVVGLGDVAPLAGFSSETLDEAAARWAAIQGEVAHWTTPRTPQEMDAMSPELDKLTTGLPSLRYGLESAFADQASRRAGIAMARWLCVDSTEEIEVNALLTSDDPVALAQQAQTAFANGFRTFKMKVAVGSVLRDVERVAAVRNAVPKANLRIDANAGWTESQVKEVFPLLRDFELEFVEQPLPAGQAALARRYARAFGIPLALDEEIRDSSDAKRLIAEGLCDAIVLKPMAAGGLVGNLALAGIARQAGVKVIYTSTWESDVGLAGTLHLACAAGSAAAPSGLSTAGMICDGLVEPGLRINGGRLAIARHVGLGLQLARPAV